MTLEVVELPAVGAERWNAFMASSPDAWFWHTTDWLEYSLAHAARWAPVSRAFAVMAGTRILAACPLVVETPEPGAREFSMSGGACPAPALSDSIPPRLEDDVLDALLSHIEALAAREQVRRVRFRRSPLARSADRTDLDPLLRRGFLDVSIAARVIDLAGRGESELWRDVRHGHRYDIRRGERHLRTVVVDATSFDTELFEVYVDLHRLAAGRVTRARRTFDMMREWVRTDHAALFLAYDDARPVGAALVLVDGDGAFYASAANDPEWRGVPAGHLLQWRILGWLRDRGTRRYDLGPHSLVDLPHAPVSAKERAITVFKRGFGGRTVPLTTAERYFDPEFYRREMTDRVQRYAERVG